MWEQGTQLIDTYEDANDSFLKLEGELDDLTARLTLISFMRRNLGWTFEMMSGMRLLLAQEIMLKCLFMRENGLIVAGRGVGKSTIIAMFCCLYPIFFPRSSICLISANFRGARRIFDAAEKMVKGRYAYLLQGCFPTKPSRLNDILSWKLENGSEIFALPLSNGDGLRGTRASTVFVDEGLLISEEMQRNIIRPFLTANQNYQEEMEIKERESELIKAGVMKESERISFPKNKYLVCSSASYDFEYLHTMYKDYIRNIVDVPAEKRDPKDPRYVVIRASYETLPAEDSFLDMSAIDSARNEGGEDSDYFKREYKALFSSGSSSYFSPLKMAKCTVKDGETPTVQLWGKKNEKYILAIDPSYSSSKSSDFFAMGVYMLVPESRRMILVHSYGKAGTDLSEHYKYLTYLLQKFNIVWITIDSSGTEFIDSYNQSVIATENGIKLGYLEVKMDADDYLGELTSLKNQYNQEARRIVYPQPFSSESIRRMNEHLQAGIDSEKVWFASNLETHEQEFAAVVKRGIVPIELKNKDDKVMDLEELIYEQCEWIPQTKKQLTLIEVKATALGTMQFDLPSHIRKMNSPNKPRRDNYTCLLMAYTAAKYYFDMIFTEIAPPVVGFTPFAV